MNRNGANPNNVKVVIIGNSDVGKTALMERFMYDKFTSRRGETIGAAYAVKKITRGRQTLVLSIWDTAGTERYRAMMKQYYRNAKAAIVCYDITNNVSLEVLKSWVTELRNNEQDCRIYICGTKKDLVDDGKAKCDVDRDKIKFYAECISSPSIETSSKTGENVDKLFTMIADDLWHEALSSKVSNRPTPIDLCDSAPKRSCCSK
ncbi:hypothetical protein GE061_007365 [Apolygus lucorum]|uniref:Uncharacterized protein n=1 Tax=Apolygus lucorum TaxID=248454 RepID=A0A6A4JB68_APOLU|nr:hypothetical protein GE061_007365 [Apolygus lucorum]